jgi:hypothetical protein
MYYWICKSGSKTTSVTLGTSNTGMSPSSIQGEERKRDRKGEVVVMAVLADGGNKKVSSSLFIFVIVLRIMN